MRAHDYFYRDEVYIEAVMLMKFINERSPFPVKGVLRDDSYDSGCYYNLTADEPCEFHTGLAELNACSDSEILPGYLLVKTVVDIFHEYHHAVQTECCRHCVSSDNELITAANVSKYFSYYFPEYYRQNRVIMPHELDAERTAILMARQYIHRLYPRFDFDTALFNYISNSGRWYGPDRKRKQGDSTEETLSMLESWQKDCSCVLIYKKPSDGAIIKMKQMGDLTDFSLCVREIKFSETCRINKITTAADIFAAGLKYINANVADVPQVILDGAESLQNGGKPKKSKFGFFRK